MMAPGAALWNRVGQGKRGREDHEDREPVSDHALRGELLRADPEPITEHGTHDQRREAKQLFPKTGRDIPGGAHYRGA